MSLKSQCYMFSSSTENGALNKSPKNDKFSVAFTNPLFLPENATNARIELIGSQIWNNSPNVTSANNRFTIKDPNGTHTILIEEGLYDYTSLFTQIALQMDNKLTQPILYWRFEDMFSFVGNYSTQKLSITYLYLNNAGLNQVEIIWNDSTITTLLGFTSLSPTRPATLSTPSVNYSITSSDYAKFNTYNSYLIKTDLVSQGISVNNNYANIIGIVPIEADSIGTLMNYKATNPNIFSTCMNLVGIQNARYSCRFTISNENNEDVIMPDDWFITLMVSWFEE